jgi:Flp pilus assembly secretin CpaC
MKSFIIKRKDGGISIGSMIEGTDLDQEVEKWNQSSDSKSVYHQYEDRFPEDKDSYFHDAYDHSVENGVFIDMEKARNIHMNKLIEIRKQKLNDMGFPIQLNPQIENTILDDDTKIKLKQLRDFPQLLDLSKITDPDELKYIIPDCLK